jgi:hypothetical protein
MMLTPADIATTQETPAVKPAALGQVTVDYPETGARAWRGCEPMKGDADITKLVEAFAG